MPTKRKSTTNLFPLMTFRLISLYMGSPLSRIYAIIYDRVFRDSPDLFSLRVKSKYLNVICLMNTCLQFYHFMMVYFAHVSVSVHTKLLSFEMFFFCIKLSVSAYFPTFIKTYPRKNRLFILFLVLCY